MTKLIGVAGLLTLCVLLAACASSSGDVQATYLSPVAYQDYTCSQLAEEAQRVSARAAQAAGQQDKNRNKDIVKTTVGIVIFWPILFANEGDNQTTSELARLKGQMEAIEEASIRKNCGIEFRKG